MKKRHYVPLCTIAWLVCSIAARANSAETTSPLQGHTKGTLLSFDASAPTGRTALLFSSWRNGFWVDIEDTRSHERIAGVSADYAPISIRFSPDGETLVFSNSLGNIFALDVRTNTVRSLLADKDFEGVFPSWDPAGKCIAYYQRPRDRTASMKSHLRTLSIATSNVEPVTSDTEALDITPAWSPDGQHILFLRMLVSGHRRERFTCILDVATKEVRPLLADQPGDSVVSRLHWSPDGKRVLVVKTLPGQGNAPDMGTLSMVSLAENAPIWSVQLETLEDAACSPDGTTVLGITDDFLIWIDASNGSTFSRCSISEIGPCKREVTGPVLEFERNSRDVVLLSTNCSTYRAQPSGEVELLRAANPEPLPPFEQHEYQIDAQDGFHVPVKRFVPPNPKPTVVMLAIGGPGAVVDPAQDPLIPVLLDAGYEVVAPVYRGCGGYGPEHLMANRGEWGRADVSDVVAAGIDWKKHNGNERSFVLAGYSYGAYLALLSLARDDTPWDAGITLWGMVRLQQPLLGMLEPSLPTEGGARDLALAERSPIHQAGRLQRPVLILHGALDGAATRDDVAELHKRIPHNELVVYENDGHGLCLNRKDVHRRIMEFISKAIAAQ
ncbi:MAG: alpha/beta fold hydrolase [Candidatus Hydrogenedentales bacterium]|jgi:dipeptidyl aminopeptidase/acylaminoacyl peptidase